MENTENNTTTENTAAENGKNNGKTPKFNIPYSMDYGELMHFAPKDGTQLQREVITDTYVTASENEDSMMEQISKDMEAMKSKTRGFAGYFSFYYLMLTMFYIMKKYDNCISVLDKINAGADALERYIVTGNFLDENGNDSGFTNIAFGESPEELKNTMRYIIDAYNTAKLIHMKASSFESGFSLIVTSILLHSYHKQLGMIREDVIGIRNITKHIRDFIINERDNPETEDVEASAGMSFGSIEDLKS